MRILFISCLLWTILFTRQVKGESKCLRTNRQPDRMCVTKCDPLTGCRAEEKCLCDGDCGYSCVKRDLSCGRPPRVSNARPQYPATNFSSVVTYVCNEGHTLSGAAKRTCRANGRWDGVGPNCLKMCSLPTIPFFTYIAKPVNYTRKYRTGERITLACKKGFKKKPGGNPVRICISGLWTRFPFQCEGTHACKRTIRAPRTKCTLECSPQSGCDSDKYKCLCDGSCGFSCVEIGMSCGNPPSISNGNLVYNNTSYNSTAHYSCNEGYNLNTAPVKRCTAKKRWEGLTPRCLKDCKPPTIPRNANISNPSKKYHSGYKVTFKCNEGYNQEGMATQMCFLGSWTVLPFKCTEGGCGDPGTPENGRKLGVTYSVNSKVYFDCDLGYELEGSADRKCQLNGTWTGIQPVCKVVNCGFPPRPKNGTFIGNETTFRSELEFRCDEGFELQGSARRMCTTDKSWTGKDVTCNAVDCGSLDPPKNGSLIVKETTYPNHAEIRCDEGFTLLGPRRRTCQANGTWSGNIAECKAVDCGALSVPTNGSFIGTETTFPNEIRFRCDTGFDLFGSSVRMCMPDKSWNGVKTVCKAVDCGKLPHPTNGSVIGKETTFPNEVEISCDKGFILRGSHRRKCKADRNWSGDTTVCEAVDCGRPQPLRNGSVIGENTVYPNFVIHNCDEGFILRGPAEIKCQTNGTWSQTDSFCEAKDCGNLSKPLNGSMTGLETTFPNKVSFNCDEGFILSGSSVRYCQSNGSWSGTETTCTAVDCGSLPAPMNGSSHGVATVFPNGIQFSCEPGFILSGSAERTCQPNGTWSGVTTVCTAIDCGPLAVPTNGSSIGFLTTFPNKIDFSCDEGFFLRGSQTRHCEENGTWSGNQTFCQAVDCGSLSVPVNGSSSGDSTLFPNSVLFNCDTGFILSGSTVRTCQPNATWSGSPTTCSAIDCGSLSVPMNGSSSGNSTVFPNSVHFQCDPGFLLNGSAIRTCQANGTWGGLESLCIAVDCGNPQPLQNGSIVGNKTVYPNSVTHRCDEGFLLHGSSRITCQANGTWSKTSSYCEARNCGVLDIPVNGSITGSKTTYPSKLHFSCDDGFILRGSTTRQCLADGTWSGNDTSCEAVDCGRLLVPVNGSSSGNFTVFPNSVIFKCDPGFNLYGSPMRMCQANGTWSGKAVSCSAKDCGPLAAPTNGSSTGELTFFPNEIAFDCDKGFLLKGSSIRHCQTNGNWSGNQTFCKAVDCGLLSNPMNGSSSGESTVFPNSVLFDCDSGFILSGSHERKCLANGSWSGFPTVCSAVDCGPLSAPKNGSSTGNLTVFPNSVAFNCDPGFLLNGSATRKCQANGTWSGLQAVCNAIDCGMPQPLQNGTVIGEFTVYPNFVTHICDEGFVLRGPPKIKCQTNGTWSKSSTFCEAKDCGAPVVPVNGSATGQKTTFANEVTFSCDEGFILNGSTVRRCQANGSWSGVQTSCRAVDCGPLSAPKNGSFVGDSTVFPNSLLFACNLGFILDGSYRRTCQANGTWDGLETVCIAKDCGALEIPANGSLHGDLTTFPNKVDFNCDQGFLLSGSQTRRCQGNGTWSGIQTYCEAVDCGPLYVPMNGSASGNSTVFPNSVQFSCDPGFILNGFAVRTCQPHGTWNGTKTVCVAVDCGPLPVPTNGSSSGDSTVFPNAIQFSCDPGFILSGSASRMCQTNGTWSGFSTECSAIDCGWPEPLQNGSIIGKFTVYPNSVRHICDMGFVLRGSPEIKCQANGTWSKTSSFCEAKDCGALEVPLNGSITGRETTFPNEAMLSCDVGFILHGSSFRRCQANGTWSGTKTVCKAVDCGSLSAPRNGSSLGNFTVFPNELLFYCDPGFLLGGSSTRTCQANGTWSGIETICTPVDCGPLRPLQYGSYNGTSTVFPNVVNAVCDMGFILRGSSRIKCQVNGTWSSNDTFCDAKDCGNLPRPLNGSVIGDKTTYPSEVEFECDAGFNLQGSTIRRCEADGQWSGVEVKCRAVDCGRLAIPEHGFAHGNSTTYPNTITFSCNTGFSLHGTSSRTCQADGTWTSGKTRCQGEDCGKLLPPDNGWMYGSDTSHPSEVLFRCGPGYSIVGSSQRTCLRNGSWSGQQPRCLPRWCSQAPDVPAFAYQTWTAKNKRYEDGERIYYSCKAGLMMVGIPMRKCVKGRWTKANFRCSAPSCDAPPVPKFAYLTWARGARSKYLNGETAYYSCQAGYELIGIPYIECKDSGWTKIDFSCKAVDCGFLESPPNGGIAKKTGKTFGAIYVFECDEDKGYLMDGSKERRCQADATWSGVQPVCKLQSCVTPSKPMHGKFKSEPRSKYYFENIVGYQCDSGYSLRGHERTKCLIHGNWSHAAPTCTGCSKPLGLKSRMIFSRQLSASSERDSRHSARHGRLDGNSAWCSARSSFAKYFQIDFGRTVEVTSVATQGHPREEKWIQRYILRYSLGKNWFTYQASGRDKVFKGNRDGRSAVRHYLKERLVAKKLRIVRHENSRDFMGSTVCLRAEVYGCSFDTECLTFGSEVFAHWNSIKKHTRYIHGYVTKVHRTSVHISPSGKHGGNADSIFELPRKKEFYVIKDEKCSPQEIKIGSDVIVASKDNVGFSQGKVTQKYYSWYGVELGNGKTVWGKVDEIRLLKRPIYCEKEYITA